MTVTALIAEGADVNCAHPETRHTPLYSASLNGHLSVVNALIAARAVVDRLSAQGFTALTIAAHNGHEAVVNALHRVAGASVHHAENNGYTVCTKPPSRDMLESCAIFSELELTRM